MNKVYERINWENYPSIHTPINEKNLNKLDFAADALDNRIINLDTAKVDKSSIQTNVAHWTMDSDTGIITITKVNGEKVIFDLNIEKIPVDFKLTAEGILIMTTDDGTQFKADIGSMIPILTFNSSSEIQVTVTGTGINKVYSFSIIKNSITEDKLEANYLADIKTEVAKAQSSSKTATDAATTATNMANSAKSYSESAASSKRSAETAASISETNLQQSATYASQASTSANNAAKSEANAKTSKNQSDLNAELASQSATLSKSYAVGGTNTRTDEDTDNAKYYYEQLKGNQPVIIYNDQKHTHGNNNYKTADDIVQSGFAVGMLKGTTNNPVYGLTPNTPWFHILTMGWDNNNLWNSQLAIGVSTGTGLYYRTTNGEAGIQTKNWTRVLDSQNYKEYLSGGTSTKNVLFILPGNDIGDFNFSVWEDQLSSYYDVDFTYKTVSYVWNISEDYSLSVSNIISAISSINFSTITDILLLHPYPYSDILNDTDVRSLYTKLNQYVNFKNVKLHIVLMPEGLVDDWDYTANLYSTHMIFNDFKYANLYYYGYVDVNIRESFSYSSYNLQLISPTGVDAYVKQFISIIKNNKPYERAYASNSNRMSIYGTSKGVTVKLNSYTKFDITPSASVSNNIARAIIVKNFTIDPILGLKDTGADNAIILYSGAAIINNTSSNMWLVTIYVNRSDNGNSMSGQLTAEMYRPANSSLSSVSSITLPPFSKYIVNNQI